MEPWLGHNDKQMFYKYLNKASIYFEFGSGGSTYQACLKQNIQKIYSVESDLRWNHKLRQILKNETKVQFIYNEMNARPNTWGYPGKNSIPSQRKKYSDQILIINENERKKIDLVLIDGRFRVACCLKCFGVVSDDCVIVFDDFLDRPNYHIVLNYYDIIEKTRDNRMVILKKKLDVDSIPKQIIDQYELNSA
jgi:protein O-GlcNAc transferase